MSPPGRRTEIRGQRITAAGNTSTRPTRPLSGMPKGKSQRGFVNWKPRAERRWRWQMLDEYDWRLSEDRYWAEYGSFTSQVMRYNEIAKRERREEMNVAARAFDWLLEALFPKWH